MFHGFPKKITNTDARIYENLQNYENRKVQSGDAIDQNENRKKRGIN